MLIARKDVENLKAIVRDTRSGLLPTDIAPSVLHAFFVENPHLLMIEKFDEHMQRPISDPDFGILTNFTPDNTALMSQSQSKLPLLEFRTPVGRWSSLIGLPIDELDEGYFVFSFGLRQALRQLSRVSPDMDEAEFEELVDELNDMVSEQGFDLSLDQLIADLESRLNHPRERMSLLWTPRLWAPREQARQRALLDASLAPYFKKWSLSGIRFDDLNPSEFEDLVGEVLLSAGLKVYKVRQAPQGGRDLIARGELIPGEEPIEMAVEVKHRATVDRPLVELALYQNRAYPALLFVTSGRFTAGVLKEKARDENRFRLFLKDGMAIGDLVRTHFRLEDKMRSRFLK